MNTIYIDCIATFQKDHWKTIYKWLYNFCMYIYIYIYRFSGTRPFSTKGWQSLIQWGRYIAASINSYIISWPYFHCPLNRFYQMLNVMGTVSKMRKKKREAWWHEYYKSVVQLILNIINHTAWLTATHNPTESTLSYWEPVNGVY